MAKRKAQTPKHGAPAWTTTFADLMNLLLCFFVMLFAMSSVNAEKYAQVVASFTDTFSIYSGGASSLGEGTLIGNGVSQLNGLDEYVNSMGKAAEGDTSTDTSIANDGGTTETSESITTEQAIEAIESEKLKLSEEIADKVTEAVDESNLNGAIDINFNSEYVSLTLKGAFVFDSGSATIKEESKTTLDKVGEILERYADSIIEIEGHTDNIPIKNSLFANNDELSSFRALAVFDYLIENTNLDPANIKHSGRGEYVPIADNSTEEGRALNRRVEIKIYNTLSDY